MEFKKVTISLPKNLYEEALSLINNGLFSNFSDLVRSGIRNEFREMHTIAIEFDENILYNDKALIAGVKKSILEANKGRGKLIKSSKDIDKYFGRL